MNNLSPSIDAALALNPKLGQIRRAHDDSVDLPMPTQRELNGQYPITIAETLAEAKHDLKEKFYATDLEVRAGVNARALWSAMTLKAEEQPDAIESAMVRVDAVDERRKRYRVILRRERKFKDHPKIRELRIRRSVSMFREQNERVKELATMRGESFEETLRYVIESGLILADERAKRYEAWMLRQMLNHIGNALAEHKPEPRIEAHRYVDPKSRTIRQAALLAQPMNGAPDSVAQLVSEYPAPKEQVHTKQLWW